MLPLFTSLVICQLFESAAILALFIWNIDNFSICVNKMLLSRFITNIYITDILPASWRCPNTISHIQWITAHSDLQLNRGNAHRVLGYSFQRSTLSIAFLFHRSKLTEQRIEYNLGVCFSGSSKFPKKIQPHQRFELWTPGLLDQWSNPWANEATSFRI